MYYRKNYVCAKPSRSRILLSGFKGADPDKVSTSLPCDYAEYAAGFGFKDGCLIAGPGVKYFKGIKPDLTEATLPDLPAPQYDCRLGVYRNDEASDNYNKIVVMYDNGASLLSAGDFASWSNLFYFLLAPFEEGINVLSAEGEPLYVMVSPQAAKMCVYTGTEFNEITSASATASSICKHSERIFAVMSDEDCTVRYSDAFDIYNWDVSLDAGGYITFDRDLGRIRKLVSFADYLFVFCDYGIYRVSARGDQLSFSVKRLYTACSRIFPRTIVEAGDRIIFCAGDGIYSFDGYDVTRISTRMNKYFNVAASGMCAAYCRHKYYLAFRMCDDTWTDGNNNALAVMDLDTREISISRGFYIYDMAVLASGCQNVVLGIAKGATKLYQPEEELGSFLGTAYEKEWRISGADMGRQGDVKVILSAESNSETSFTLTVTNDKGKSKQVEFSPGKCTRRLGIAGKSFDIKLSAQSEQVLIRPVTLTVDFYEGGEDAVQ